MVMKTSLKLLASFSLFITLLATGITFLNKNLEEIKSSLGDSKKLPSTRHQLPDLYYTMIGNYPDFSTQKAKVKLPNKVKYTIELNHFATQRDAVKMLETLEKKGIDAFYTPLHNNNRVVYRVRKGIFSSEKEARRVAQQIKVSSGAQGQIVRLN